MQQDSATRGNSYSGIIQPRELSTSAINLDSDFLPHEVQIQLSGRPRGIASSLTASSVVNWKSDQYDRAFHIEARLGEAWKKSHYAADLSGFYLEPNSWPAAWSDHERGFLNRRGLRARLTYYPLAWLRTEVAYVFADTVVSSLLQKPLHKAWLRGELRF
jgi:hypothetical protein